MDDQSNIEKTKQQIIVFFEGRSDEDYWKTIDEISRGTKIARDVVVKVIKGTGDFVRSSYRSKGGEPVFTSRTNFRQKAPFVDKIIGAFKNRID